MADHSLALALLALSFAAQDRSINAEKLSRMALLHDLAEAHVGDITPSDGVKAEEKRRKERNALTDMLAGHPSSALWLETWDEYAAGLSDEARLLHDLDKLEMALQARAYETELGINAQEFLDSAAASIQDEHLLGVIRRLRGF